MNQKYDVEIRTESENVYHFIFPDQRTLCQSMVRIQEHYESPEFAGKIFTLDEFAKWYIQNSPRGKETGRFTYYSDWNGGNFPEYAVAPFLKGEFNPLSEHEYIIIDFLKKLHDTHYYCILTHRDRPDAIKHELAHALFHLNNRYRKEVKQAMEWHVVTNNRMKATLLDMGYGHKVIRDEIQAYLVSGWERLGIECTAASKEILSIFNSHI